MEIELSDKARQIDVCPGCGEPKGKGLIVCWDCFKYRKDILPYKYSNKSLIDWLRNIPKNENMKIAQGSLGI